MRIEERSQLLKKYDKVELQVLSDENHRQTQEMMREQLNVT